MMIIASLLSGLAIFYLFDKMLSRNEVASGE